MLDSQGRPYFLWDMDITVERFKELLGGDDEEVRAHMLGKLMRQAKPDDVFTFIGLKEIRELWPAVESRLGKTREFWTWLLGKWNVIEHD